MRPTERRWRENIVDALLHATMVEGSSDRGGEPVNVAGAGAMVAWAKSCIAHDLSCASEMAALVTVVSLASVVEGTDNIVSAAVGCLMREAALSSSDAKRAIYSGFTMATGGSARSERAREFLIDTMGAMWEHGVRPSAFEITDMIERLASLRAEGGIAIAVDAEPFENEPETQTASETEQASKPEQVPGAPLDTSEIASTYQLPREMLDEIARIVREASMQAVEAAIGRNMVSASAQPESAVQPDGSVQPETASPEETEQSEPTSESETVPDGSTEQSSDVETKAWTEEEWLSHIAEAGDEQAALDLFGTLIADPGGWEDGDDTMSYVQNTMEAAAGQETVDDPVLETLIKQRRDSVANGISDCDPEQCAQFLIRLVHLKLPQYRMPDDVAERMRPLGEVLATGQIPLWAELLRTVGYIDDAKPLTYDIDNSGDSYRHLVNGYIKYDDEDPETQFLLTKALGLTPDMLSR